MTRKPHAIEKDQAINEFLAQVRGIARYWGNLPDKTPHERCEGTAFSILSLLDGSNVNFPAVQLALDPHPDDKEYNEERGMDWYEPGMVINDKIHLHEHFYAKE
jgi:hypothetical protein